MELYVTAFCKLGLGKNIQSQNSENTKKLTNIFKNRVRTLDRRTYRIFMVRRWAKKIQTKFQSYETKSFSLRRKFLPYGIKFLSYRKNIWFIQEKSQKIEEIIVVLNKNAFVRMKSGLTSIKYFFCKERNVIAHENFFHGESQMIIPPAMFMVMEGAMAPWFPRRRVQSGGGRRRILLPPICTQKMRQIKIPCEIR